ncbi:MAG: hypothetical protein QHJ73_16000, partial [Armatimonadota bacterium]|nr:hypothetical protein [Armatimonadota bacterium]
ASAAALLAQLKPGDAVQLRVARGGKEYALEEALAAASWSTPLKERCSTLYVALATEHTAAPGVLLGSLVLTYAGGVRETLPVRYGHRALPLSGFEPPQAMGAGAWIVHRTPTPSRVLVCEWQNPKPGNEVVSLSFEPAPAALELGYRVLAVTAAVAAKR